MAGTHKDIDFEQLYQQTIELENREWAESLNYVMRYGGAERTRELLRLLGEHAKKSGVAIDAGSKTPYVNTIPVNEQPTYPGNLIAESEIEAATRWNAMAMVVKANQKEDGIGGHLSTYASAATLYEVAFNHFLRGKGHEGGGDLVYYQGHASPGIYARAFLEGRLNETQLNNFRRELQPGGGLSSYPHPWLMPDFWEFPTVSMGLAPIMSIYQARFNRYVTARGLRDASDMNVWAFLGDGEMDEPESIGAIAVAAREKLDNLTWVINCNLQRLDGPVRGNGKIVQELEGLFRGAGWNVIKVLWSSDWDPIFAKDNGTLAARLGEVVDGQFQKYSVSDGAFIREDLFGADPYLLSLVEHLSDEELAGLERGGHDPYKVYAAYASAMQHKGQPTVILAHTVKGYGLGGSAEGKNVAHQQKKLKGNDLTLFRVRFAVPVKDADVEELPFITLPEGGEASKYMHDQRQKLGGYAPMRQVAATAVKTPAESVIEEFFTGSDGREVSTTMVFVRIMAKLLRDKELGKLVVPIIPDEARTFGMEGLFRQYGIYAPHGQLYEPVDKETLLYYKEAKDGQILEEGISEAGAMSSFIAAGTAYATHGVNTIPFFIYYSMFGFQRIGDLVWAAGDMCCRGFLVGGTAGRTTLSGEGLQHQDGHSHQAAFAVPNVVAYDPAFAYELAVIVRDGIRRMYENQEKVFYYITVENENYEMPAMPREDVKEGILKGMYLYQKGEPTKSKVHAALLGSGAIMNEAIKAQKILQDNYGVCTDVYSVTSYKCLRRDAINCERWNMLNPDQDAKVPYVTECLESKASVYVAASDYLKSLPDSIARWVPGKLHTLGTNGFGRSEGRKDLRDFFEVDAKFIVLATLAGLAQDGKMTKDKVSKAMKDLGIEKTKVDPLTT